MNTRLQVEHPVTELITGKDLVEEQFTIAAGEPLSFAQEELCLNGHAIEARLYAEDPFNEFLPQTGKLLELRWPRDLPGLRIDSGVVEGAEISPFYDPMIAKVISHGCDREEALKRLSVGLEEIGISGLRTNLAFLHALVNNKAFGAAKLDTGFIETHWEEIVPDIWKERALVAAVLTALEWQRLSNIPASSVTSPWDMPAGWSMAG